MFQIQFCCLLYYLCANLSVVKKILVLLLTCVNFVCRVISSRTLGPSSCLQCWALSYLHSSWAEVWWGYLRWVSSMSFLLCKGKGSSSTTVLLILLHVCVVNMTPSPSEISDIYTYRSSEWEFIFK